MASNKSMVTDSDTFTVTADQMRYCNPGLKFCTPKRSISEIPDFEWWVEYYPAGYDHNSYDCLSCELVFSGPVSVKLNVYFTNVNNFFHVDEIKLDAARLRQMTFTARVPDFYWLLETNINHSTHQSLNMVINVEFERPGSTQIPEWTFQKDLWEGPKVVLAVNDGDVEVSKALLSHVSPVFNAMFMHDTTEKATDRVEIPDFDVSAIQAFLDYCKGKFVHVVPSDAFFKLMWFADKYGIGNQESGMLLAAHMESYIVGHVTPENVFSAAKYAEAHSHYNMTAACLRCFRANISRMRPAPEEKETEMMLLNYQFRKVDDRIFK